MDKYFAIYYQFDGKRYEEGLGWSSQGWTLDKAVITLAELKKAQQSGEGPVTLAEKRAIEKKRRECEEAERKAQERDALTFADFFQNTYTPHARADKKANTWRTEELIFRLWLDPIIGHLPVRDISPLHLEKIKKVMAEKGRAPRTIQYALAVCRQTFNYARAVSSYVGDNPVGKVRKPSIDNRRMRFLNQQEAGQLLSELKSRSKQAHDIALLSLHCGLRAGEIFALQWTCVDFERGLLLLKDTKSGRNRIAYMTDAVKCMLAENQAIVSSQFVFVDRKGRPLREVSHTFARAVQALGLNKGIEDPRQKVVFHSLRHTFASWLVEAGADLYAVAKLLGHSTIVMAERYSHLSENALRQAVANMQRGFSKAITLIDLQIEK